MKKNKEKRSEAAFQISRSDVQIKEEDYIPYLDIFTVKILGLQVTDEVCKHYAIKVTFFDQLIITSIIKSVSCRSTLTNYAIISGTMNFDPSDYEKMCLFADYPLVVYIQPLKSLESNLSRGMSSNTDFDSYNKTANDIGCCNIDVLPVFIGNEKLVLKKRVEPIITPPLLHRQSWDNLPLLTIEVGITRNPANTYHHNMISSANSIKISVIGAFNMQIPEGDEFVYTAATKVPLCNETNTGLVTYNQGYRVPKNFNNMNFYPNWESLRIGDDLFSKADEKFVSNINAIQNTDSLDLKYYMSKRQNTNTILWGSFHRTLMLDNTEEWLLEHLREKEWPFEVHMYSDNGGLSFMAFLNLFYLLYPGENKVQIAVPLEWINAQMMQKACECDTLLTPNDNIPSTSVSTPKSKLPMDSAPTSIDTSLEGRPTGADENCAFIVVSVELARPLKRAVIPSPISSEELRSMLRDMEQSVVKRESSGRGQSDRDWISTVRTAEGVLRKIPYYATMEFSAFNRQLSETRTRVELLTSSWLDAAIFVNNHFVIQDFLRSGKLFEEMLMMSHACLLRIACSTLLEEDNRQQMDPTLRAARQARHMQDISHATELYLQLVVQRPYGANEWRELSTCLKDVDNDWATVCLDNAVLLDTRHPLTLLSKGCMLLEIDPEAAEPFFEAILAFRPTWSVGLVAVSAYYWKRELYHIADQIMEWFRKSQAEGQTGDLPIPRAWAYELGDWWDHTPLLPGMSPYYSAADLLLRIRAINLAEVCMSRAITETGESAASCHLVALCSRLRGNFDEALCHLRRAIDKYGDINYLCSLEAECHHKKKDTASAISAFQKAGGCLSGYSILLSMPSREPQHAGSMLLDLLRRQPSAYAWLALTDSWLHRVRVNEGGDAAGASEENTAAKKCTIACAIQALKWDRQSARAWAILSRLVGPSARRLHCKKMARACGYQFTEDRSESKSQSKQSLCHILGKALRECRCVMCEHLTL